MPTINKLCPIDVLSPADQFPIWQTVNGDPRRVSANILAQFVNAQFQSQIEQYVRTALSAYFSDLPTVEPVDPGLPWLNHSVVSISGAS